MGDVEMGLGPYNGPGPRSRYNRALMQAMNVWARAMPYVAAAGTGLAVARRRFGGKGMKRTAEMVKRNRAKKKLALAFNNTRNVNRSAYRKGYVKKSSTRGYIKKGRKRSSKKTYQTSTVEEVSGTITDENAVYIVHTSCDSFQLIEQTVRFIIRKLLLKAGLVVMNDTEIITGLDFSNGEGYVIQLLQEQTDAAPGGIRSVIRTHTTVAGSNIISIATAFVQDFFAIASPAQTLPGVGNVNNSNILSKFIIFETVGGNKRLMCELDLKNIMIDIYSRSTIKIQNRTRSGDGTEQTDNVNNNPLEGYVYMFSGSPKARSYNAGYLQNIPTNSGVQLVRSSQYAAGDATYFREPPRSSDFYNCTGKTKIYLNPGQVKIFSVDTKKSMYLHKLLRKIQFNANTALNGYSLTNCPFPCQMICLEDVINVDLAERIEVAYEVDRKMSVGGSVKSKMYSQRVFDQSTASNIQPPPPPP